MQPRPRKSLKSDGEYELKSFAFYSHFLTMSDEKIFLNWEFVENNKDFFKNDRLLRYVIGIESENTAS
jgi:hypothetical protein